MGRATPFRVGELAERLGRPLEGDASRVLRGAAAVDAAGPDDLCYVGSPAYAALLRESAAGAVILLPGLEAGGRPAIRSPSPRLDFARAVGWILPPASPPPGVHPSAVVAPDAEVDPSACVDARVVIGDRCRIGARSVLHAGVILYPDVRVGADCRIHAGAVLREETLLGDRVVLQPGVVLGGDGFGFEPDAEGHFAKVPQVGRVVVEDDVEIGANTTIDRAALGDTRIGRGSKLDNLVMVAHGVELGPDCVLVAQTGISGSTRVGRRSVFMGQSGASGHLEIGDGVIALARAAVLTSQPAGARLLGFPAEDHRRWRRVNASVRRLPEALRRLTRIERHLGLRRDRSEDPPERLS